MFYQLTHIIPLVQFPQTTQIIPILHILKLTLHLITHERPYQNPL